MFLISGSFHPVERMKTTVNDNGLMFLYLLTYIII
jgi:hypothetical protein